MKTLSKISLSILVLLIVLFSFPTSALAQTPINGSDQIVFGGTFTLNSGQTLIGDLVIFGGLATLENGSVVKGDVVLTGGSVNINGEVTGSITAVGGSINLSDSAVVNGDVNTIGGSLNRSTLSVVKGNIASSGPGTFRLPLNFNLSNLQNIPLSDIFHPISNVLWGIFQSLAIAALALLVMLFLPTPARRVSDAVIAQPVIAGALGLLTIVVAPALILILAITILLIPLSFIGILLLVLAFLFGWIAIGLEAGDRLSALFKVQWAPPVSAGIGTLVLSLFSSVFAIVPCIGWVIPTVIAVAGLGGVFLTRFGTRNGHSDGMTRVVPPVPLQPPAMPVPPAATQAAGSPFPPIMPTPSAPPDDIIPPTA